MKLLVIEDHPIVIAGCRALFSNEPGVMLEEALSLADARLAIAKGKPDVVVVDINLPDGSGLDLTRACAAQPDGPKVVVFSMSDAPTLAFQALECGARGYVSKNGDPMRLKDAVEAVSRGQTWIHPDLLQELAALRAGTPQGQQGLSSREVKILHALVRGRSMSEIAKELSLSYKTVATDCTQIRSKLGARTTPEMVRIAIAMKLV